MGKAAKRQRKKKVKFLGDIAECNQELFAQEWRKRICSYCEEITKRLEEADPAYNSATDDLRGPAYAVIQEAEDLLDAIINGAEKIGALGRACVRKEKAWTKTILTEWFNQCLARSVHTGMAGRSKLFLNPSRLPIERWEPKPRW